MLDKNLSIYGWTQKYTKIPEKIKYPEIPESKKDTRKYLIVYFDTPTRPEPDPLPGIFSDTRPDPILKNPTRWALGTTSVKKQLFLGITHIALPPAFFAIPAFSRWENICLLFASIEVTFLHILTEQTNREHRVAISRDQNFFPALVTTMSNFMHLQSNLSTFCVIACTD